MTDKPTNCPWCGLGEFDDHDGWQCMSFMRGDKPWQSDECRIRELEQQVEAMEKEFVTSKDPWAYITHFHFFTERDRQRDNMVTFVTQRELFGLVKNVHQEAFAAGLREFGFRPQRPFLRMAKGTAISFGAPDKMFAMAGPELG